MKRRGHSSSCFLKSEYKGVRYTSPCRVALRQQSGVCSTRGLPSVGLFLSKGVYLPGRLQGSLRRTAGVAAVGAGSHRRQSPRAEPLRGSRWGLISRLLPASAAGLWARTPRGGGCQAASSSGSSSSARATRRLHRPSAPARISAVPERLWAPGGGRRPGLGPRTVMWGPGPVLPPRLVGSRPRAPSGRCRSAGAANRSPAPPLRVPARGLHLRLPQEPMGTAVRLSPLPSPHPPLRLRRWKVNSACSDRSCVFFFVPISLCSHWFHQNSCQAVRMLALFPLGWKRCLCCLGKLVGKSKAETDHTILPFRAG